MDIRTELQAPVDKYVVSNRLFLSELFYVT